MYGTGSSPVSSCPFFLSELEYLLDAANKGGIMGRWCNGSIGKVVVRIH